MNYAESGGNTNRVLFTQAGTAAINVLAASARSHYNSLQVAVNRPFKNGFLLKGAYTLSKAMNETDDDGGGYTWAQPSQFSRNYALAGYDRPHMLQMGFVYELPFAKNSSNPVGAGDQGLAGQRDRVVAVGDAVHHRRRQRPAAAVRAASRRSMSTAIPSRASARPGLTSSGTTRRRSLSPATRGGTPGATQFRGPGNWNLDFSLFRTIPFGHYRVEIRAESQNVFNHPQWANPVTGFTDPNFMRIRTLARAPRTIQLGMRFTF